MVGRCVVWWRAVCCWFVVGVGLLVVCWLVVRCLRCVVCWLCVLFGDCCLLVGGLLVGGVPCFLRCLPFVVCLMVGSFLCEVCMLLVGGVLFVVCVLYFVVVVYRRTVGCLWFVGLLVVVCVYVVC